MFFRRRRRPDERQEDRREIAQPSTKDGERIYAIGDIHGRYDLLRELLATISAHARALPPAKTFLVILGDMIDRGEQSADVLKYLINVQEGSDGLIVLMGNHEELMLRAMQREPGMLRAWMRIGGEATLRSFGLTPPSRDDDPEESARRVAQAVPPQWVEWLKTLPLVARSGDYFFCHAGIRPGVALNRQSRADLLWIRDEFLEDPEPQGVVVVHGHSIAAEVEMRSNRIGIDTGAYKTGVLTALYLEGTARETLSTAGPTRSELRAMREKSGDAPQEGGEQR